jgi:hypothetical protein
MPKNIPCTPPCSKLKSTFVGHGIELPHHFEKAVPEYQTEGQIQALAPADH